MITEDLLNKFQKETMSAMKLQDQLLEIIQENFDSIQSELLAIDFSNKKMLLRILLILNSIIYARPLNIPLYCKILNALGSIISKYFEPYELASILDNKSALLVLLELKLINSNFIIQKLMAIN